LSLSNSSFIYALAAVKAAHRLGLSFFPGGGTLLLQQQNLPSSPEVGMWEVTPGRSVIYPIAFQAN